MTDETTTAPATGGWVSPIELLRYYSTQVMLAITLAAEYLVMMPPAKLAELVAQYPLVSQLMPVAAFVVWAAARAKKQAKKGAPQ